MPVLPYIHDVPVVFAVNHLTTSRRMYTFYSEVKSTDMTEIVHEAPCR